MRSLSYRGDKKRKEWQKGSMTKKTSLQTKFCKFVTSMQKTISILLSLLLLLSTTGLTYGQHFCEGIVVDKSLALGFETMSCAEVEADDACENNPAEDDCCSDTYFQIQTDKEFSVKSSYASLEIPPFVAVETNFLIEVDPFSREQQSFAYYTPPERNLDLQALLQTYLI